VLQLGEDAVRQFAPRLAEVRAEILKAVPAATVSQSGPCISIRACEMIAEARVFLRSRSVPAEEVAAELQRVLAERRKLGVVVSEQRQA